MTQEWSDNVENQLLLDNIPKSLRSYKAWLLWKKIPVKNQPEKKPVKLPYYADGTNRRGEQGSDEDAANWATFEVAKAKLLKGGGYAGLGFALSKTRGAETVALDLDHCLDPASGEVTSELAERIIALSGSTYMERSPSGDGLHIWFSGEYRDVKDVDAGLEVFCGQHFLTMTGDRFGDCGDKLLALPDELRVLLDAELKADKRQTRGRPRGSTTNAKYKHYTLETVKDMLRHVDADDRETWRGVGIILGRTYNRCEEAWDIYCEWAEASPKYSSKDKKNMHEAFYVISTQKARSGDGYSMSALVRWAKDGGWKMQVDETAFEKFYHIHPAGKVLYVPSGQLWTTQTVDNVLPRVHVGDDEGKPIYQQASKWLAQNRGIETMCSDPALPQISENMVARAIGIAECEGATMYNQYRPPTIKVGNVAEAAPFIEHVHKLFEKTEEAEHIIAYLAHRVQRPGQKVRHALLIGGDQGIGKDTIFDACLPAIGEWNCASIAPDDIFKPFNEYKAAVLVRINEVADLHDVSRYKFYEATKNLISGSPDGTEVNPKYGHKYYVRNCAGVVLTTNYIGTGLFLPADDRRHFAAEARVTWESEDARDAYFKKLWDWLLNGGFAHVAAFLHAYDLTRFDPNAPPPKTETFYKIVDNSKGSDGWLADALEKLANMPNCKLAANGLPMMVRADALRDCIDSQDITSNEISARLATAMARFGYETYPDLNQPDRKHRLRDAQNVARRVVVYVLKTVPRNDRAALLPALAPGGTF